MKVGDKFLNDKGQEFEIIAIDGDDCVIESPSGKTLTLSLETLRFLKFVKNITESEIWD